MATTWTETPKNQGQESYLLWLAGGTDYLTQPEDGSLLVTERSDTSWSISNKSTAPTWTVGTKSADPTWTQTNKS